MKHSLLTLKGPSLQYLISQVAIERLTGPYDDLFESVMPGGNSFVMKPGTL